MDARKGACALVALAAALAPPLAAAPAAAQETGLVAVTEHFHGKVVRATKKGEVAILYDFEDPVQLVDFEASIPFRDIQTVEPTLERGRLRVKGTGSIRHKAVFDGLVGADATFSPRKPRDFGYAVTEERESEVFTLYCVQDEYFGLGDGVTHPQNMIIKFIPRDPKVNRDGYQDWRYCGSRGEKPGVERNQPVRVRMEREGVESRMWLLDWKSQGREAGRDLSTQMAAVYVKDSDVEIDDLTISGRLSPAYIERHRLDLSVEIGEPETPPEPEIDPAEAARVRGLLADYPARTTPVDLAKLLRDPAVPEPLRAEAVQRAIAVADKRIVPFAVAGLYAEDEPSRRLSFEVVKELVGKTFGYKPDAPEEKRSKAVASLNEYIQKNQRQFQ